MPRQHGIKRGAKVAAIHGYLVAGPAAVELPAVHEVAIRVENVEVRRTRRFVGLGDGLVLIDQVGKRVTLFGRFPAHVLGTVSRVRHQVVAVDRVDRDALVGIIASDAGKLRTHVFDERAVVANEHDEIRICGWCERVHRAVGVGERERRRTGAEFEHLGFCGCHSLHLMR